jgi:chitinase
MERFNFDWLSTSLLITLLVCIVAAVLVFPTRAGARPNHIIWGYSACWQDDAYPPEGYDYGALTHIARSFIEPDADGHLPIPKNYFDPTLTKMAKANGVKLIASLGGAAAGNGNWMSISTHPEYLKRFLGELDEMITKNGYDGVDIDWENAPRSVEEHKAYASFMKALRARFPKLILSTALMVGDQWFKNMNWKDVSASMDYLGLMTYDFSGEWSDKAAYHSNLYSVPGTQGEDVISVDEVAGRLTKKYSVCLEKAVMGVPFYGKLFFVDKWYDPLPTTGTKSGGLRYSDVLNLIKSGDYVEKWDDEAKEPYLKKKKGPGLGTYDNPKSLAIKCKYVIDHNMPGVLIWVLGSDIVGNRTVLLDALAKEFGAKGSPIPPAALADVDFGLVCSVKSTWDDLSEASRKLSAAGKTEEAKIVDPGHCPDLHAPSVKDPKKLARHVKTLQVFLTKASQRSSAVRKALASLPAPQEVVGDPAPKGDSFLLDDFEKKGINRLGFAWETSIYPRGSEDKLGPDPFVVAEGGCPESTGHSARIWGVTEKTLPPWPQTALKCALAAEGKALDLSAYNAVQFWAKGDGGNYSLTLERAMVGYGAQYQGTFLADHQWRKITIYFSKMRQSRRGGRVKASWKDGQTLSFQPVHGLKEAEFDLSVDQIMFVKVAEPKPE